MAQRGARTLLIESDLRKPVLQRRLMKDADHLGMADFLNDNAISTKSFKKPRFRI